MHYKHAFSRRYLSNVCLTHFSKWKKVHEIAERAHLLLCIVLSFRLFSNAKYRCLEFVWTVQQWTRSRIHLPMQWMERYTALHLPLIRVLLKKWNLKREMLFDNCCVYNVFGLCGVWFSANLHDYDGAVNEAKFSRLQNGWFLGWFRCMCVCGGC